MQESIMQEYQKENKRLMQQVKLLQSSPGRAADALQQPVEQSPYNVQESQQAQEQLMEFQLAANAREENCKQEAAALKRQLEAQEQRHSKEMNEAKSKLDWYRQNQQLITQNEDKLREQTNLIEMLKKKLTAAADNAVVTYNDKNGKKATMNSRAVDLKRITELEAKCRGLEESALKRNPKSVAALIQAAKPSDKESKIVKQLEGELKQAKEQLESSNESHDRAMRSLRQQYERVKGEYDRRLEMIQQQAHGSEGNALISRLQGNLQDITATHEQQLHTAHELSDSLSSRVNELEEQLAGRIGAPPADASLRQQLAQAHSQIEQLQQQQAVSQQQLAAQQISKLPHEAAFRREIDSDRERYREAIL